MINSAKKVFHRRQSIFVVAMAEMRKLHMRSPERATLLKVVILGDGAVGKSCLMHRFISDRFDAQSFHTIGVEFLNKDIVVNGDKYTLQIWDTAGQERFRSLRTPFYRGTDICLLTYSVDDKSSFNNLKMWIDEFKLYADVPDNMENFPFVVVGNKCDKSSHEVSAEQVADWCSQHRIIAHILTSAKTAKNVTQAFTMAVERWVAMEKKAERDLTALNNTDSFNLSNLSTRQNNGNPCCSGSCQKE